MVGLALILALVLVTGLPLDPPAPRAEQGPALLISAGDGTAIASRGPAYGEPLTASTVPKLLADAVIAIEDRRFHSHVGIDPTGIARAAWVNLRAGEVRQGASTLTQQLVKNTYLTPERSFRRKFQEVAISLWLESRLSKDDILARYLNSIYFGAGAYGADAASRRYFGKPVAQVNLAEAAMLAGLIRAPSQYNPARSLEAARDRASTVLQVMVETGAIGEGAADEARAHPANLAIAPDTPPGWGFFADWTSQEARDRLGPAAAAGEYRIETTLDLKLQAIAESVIAERLAAEGKDRNIGEAALVAMRHDGAVLAMVGGRDYARSQFNRAAQAKRQPGSLFKLFVYLTALRMGATPSSVAIDQPITVNGWSPENFEQRFEGPVELRRAFAESINTVAVQLSEQVGRQRVIETARSMGVMSPLPDVPSLALGSAEMTMMELMGAYGAVAANTARLEPYGVQRIAAPGRDAYLRAPMVATPPAWPRGQMLDLMLGTVRNGTGRAAALGRPVAGKTGTTQDHRDAWFIGFTADAIVGVWVGNDDNSPMKGVTGGQMPARIWHDFMAQADAVKAGAPIPPEPAPASSQAERSSPSLFRWFFGNDDAPAARPRRQAEPMYRNEPKSGR